MRKLALLFSLILLTTACLENPTGVPTDIEGSEDSGATDADAVEDVETPTPDTGDDAHSPEPDATEPPDVADTLEPDASEPLDCDARFGFDPDPPTTGAINAIAFADTPAYVHVGVDITGPGDVVWGDLEITGDGPYQWEWEYTVDAPGIYTYVFTRDNGDPVATCRQDVLDTGAPPDLEQPPSDCLCGEGDGCDLCPTENTCFDVPSDYHPDPNQSGWQCNDVAECVGGNCKMWCPFEPCPRPDGQGCSNNTEACYVDPSIDNYEDACRQCCESRGARWNEQGKYCEEIL